MATVKEMIEMDKLECRVIGIDTVLLITPNHDPVTTRRLDDSVSQMTVQALENGVVTAGENVKKAVADEKDAKDLLAFVKDALAAEEKARNEPAAGKKK